MSFRLLFPFDDLNAQVRSRRNSYEAITNISYITYMS